MPEERLRRYRLCIFDADDTLRRTTVPGQPSPRSSAEWELLPGVAATLRSVRWNQPNGPWLGIASNQDQVGYGHLTEGTARMLLRDLAESAAGTSLPEAAIQCCPHPASRRCRCRKPAPGMLVRIMEYYGVGPGETLFVGNDETDRQAARACGVRFAHADLVFKRSAGPCQRRTRRTARRRGAGSCDGGAGRTTRE